MTPATRTIEQVIIGGDLAALSPDQRMAYYSSVCASLGLNPLTKPFQYIKLNNKLTLYATRDCTDQLRNIHQVSTVITGRELINDIYVVTCQARKGMRSDESIGAVSVAGLKGDALANAMMRAETKAKRRVTLSINGLGVLDESEVSSVPDAQLVGVDQETGEITGGSPQPSLPEPVSVHRTSSQPNRVPPKSSPGKLDQLEQARFDADGNEVWTKQDVYTFIAGHYSEAGPRDLNDEQLDYIIEAMLSGAFMPSRSAHA